MELVQSWICAYHRGGIEGWVLEAELIKDWLQRCVERMVSPSKGALPEELQCNLYVQIAQLCFGRKDTDSIPLIGLPLGGFFDGANYGVQRLQC